MCIWNSQVSTLATNNTTKLNTTPIPYIHMAHTIPYRLAKPPSTTSPTKMIRNLKAYIKKQHNRLTIAKAKQPQCANKWISNDHIYHKVSNSLWKTMSFNHKRPNHTNTKIHICTIHATPTITMQPWIPQRAPNCTPQCRHSTTSQTTKFVHPPHKTPHTHKHGERRGTPTRKNHASIGTTMFMLISKMYVHGQTLPQHCLCPRCTP